VTARAAEDWLTSPMEWDKDIVDVPFIAGKRVRVQEIKVVQWDADKRQGYNVWIDERKSFVLTIARKHKTVMLCSCEEEGCEHLTVIKRYLEN
jgi:hypothetical protein